MNKRIRILPLAKQDILNAKHYYDKIKSGLGRSLTTEIDEKLHIIAANAEIGLMVEKNVRRLLIQKFPFGIYYALTGEIIFVVAFLHLSMSPSFIADRLRS